ncbi:MAG: 1-deoxy-D-xylulose-5-phosphate synthase, partial [Rhizobiales bacterium]|nr:1-deoxy-D-xylulose-5-phosphate synthase [Hyphomicrobiales bacterium]
PCAFRYPRGEGVGVDLPDVGVPLEIGKGKIVKQADNDSGDIAILSYGTRLQESLKAAEMLEAQGYSVTVADARFAKPLDTNLIEQLAGSHKLLISIEEGAIGGFASMVLDHLARHDLLSNWLKFRPLYLPDNFIDHNAPNIMYDKAGLNAQGIVDTVNMALKA